MGVGFVFVILICLILLIDLIENMRFSEKVADGSFGLALSLTLMRLPSLALITFPFVYLFGSIWAFYQLNRRSEISVMRSAGLSIWRLLGPSSLIAAVAGLLIITTIDPIASELLASSEGLKSDKEDADLRVIRAWNDGIWLRQRNVTSQIIINARNFDAERSALEKVTVWRFGPDSVFLERIDAEEAFLSGRTLELHDARLKSISGQRERHAPIYAIQTVLTASDLHERVASPETMSLWQLPRFIVLADAAGLPTVRYHIRFHDLCSTPLKLLAMVLIAAAFSLRPVRMGGMLELLVLSIGAGFLLYILSEVSTALGEAELVPVALAAWAPALIATLIAVTALLHLEDG